MENSQDARIEISSENDEIIIRMDKDGAHLLMEMVSLFETHRHFLKEEWWPSIVKNHLLFDHHVGVIQDARNLNLAICDEIWRQKTGMTFEEWYKQNVAEEEKE